MKSFHKCSKVILKTILGLLACAQYVFAAPADYGDTSNPKTVPFQAEMIVSGANTATRTGQATAKIANMVAGQQHKYKKGADPGEYAVLAATEFVEVGAQLWPWSDCMDYKIRGFCGRRFRERACAFGVCVTLWSWDLPTSWYREYHIPVGMADTTNVRGATAMQLEAVNWPLVEAGQAIYQYFAEHRSLLDPLRPGTDKRATLPELELRRTYKGGLNAAAHRGITGLPATLNLDTSATNLTEMVALQQLARDGRDLDHREGNLQDTRQGYVTATWQTPPGYPIGRIIDVTLDAINAAMPTFWMPVLYPPLVFNDPYPYPMGFFFKLFDTCHCRRNPSLTHFVGSEYPVPMLSSGSMIPSTIIPPPILIPNLLARSPGIAQWYSTNFEWLTKMNMQLGSTAAGGLIGDPMSALNADILRGGTPRNFLPVAGTIPDMFGNQIIKPASGYLPGTYRGIQHGWINLNHRVQQASNAAASEEAIFKAFKFAHMIWPREYYNVTPYNISDNGKNADKVQWTHGKLHTEKWGINGDDEDKTCKWIGHFNTEFKKANYNDKREDVWNVGHLWKKVRCCDADHPISYTYLGLFDNATQYPQLNQNFPGCQNTPAQ